MKSFGAKQIQLLSSYQHGRSIMDCLLNRIFVDGNNRRTLYMSSGIRFHRINDVIRYSKRDLLHIASKISLDIILIGQESKNIYKRLHKGIHKKRYLNTLIYQSGEFDEMDMLESVFHEFYYIELLSFHSSEMGT